MEISEEAREKREAYCGPDAADRIADLTRERDDLLAMKARVEALADEWEKTYEWSQGLTVPSRRSLPRTVVDIRAAIRGES
jgi:hypothetical protein